MRFDKVVQYNFPTTIRFGAGAIHELGDYLKTNGFSQVPQLSSYKFLNINSKTCF